MRLTRIVLKNFRCFELLELDLHPDTNLILGINGAGKSSLLAALAVALGAWFLGFPDLPTQPIRREDVRLVRKEHPQPSLERAWPSSVSVNGIVQGRLRSWTRALRHSNGRTTTGEASQLRALAQEAAQHLLAEEAVELPVLAYYSAGRLWLERRASAMAQAPESLGSRLEGYRACLEAASDPDALLHWMRWRERIRLQEIARAIEREQLIDPTGWRDLSAVEAAVKACLPEIERFFYSANHEELRVELKDGALIPFALLSDGYRSLISLVADLAWRAARLNPHLGADAAKLAQGVVLIDEIDAHLHPTWQHLVLERLRQTFPNLQLIVSTHSPQVLSTAHPEWLIPLQQQRALTSQVPVRGRDVNTILREVMGADARPRWAQEKLAALEAALEEEHLERARALLHELQDDLGEQDASLLGLEWELHDQEVHRAPHS
jgi:predicted ATP-binding protein involved in virulence